MINKEFLTLPIDKVIPYENNPRVNDTAVNDVVASIRQCENIDPIEIDENNIILSGHTRLKALKALEYSEVQVLRITGLTDEQKRKYRILANKTAEKAEWDFEKLELELDGLDFEGYDFGFDVDLPSLEEDGQKSDDVEHSTLTDKFIVPPFSILDTRQGYWQDRKRAWKALGIKSEVGRKENLIDAPDLPQYADNGLKGIAVQTSIFDPVLAEIMYKWFCVDGGNIYDCFAGGSVRGIVADKL